MRSWHTPKINNKVTAESMRKIDVSTADNDGINLEFEQSKYLGGDDEKLKGFYESDEEPQFEMGLGANQQSKSLFGKLTTAFSNLTGNKQLSHEDMQPILDEFANSLMDKNVA